MQTPQYGALGAALQLARVFQACSLIAIIGMTANFISDIVSNNLTPPDVLIGTITVVSCRNVLDTRDPNKTMLTVHRPA